MFKFLPKNKARKNKPYAPVGQDDARELHCQWGPSESVFDDDDDEDEACIEQGSGASQQMIDDHIDWKADWSKMEMVRPTRKEKIEAAFKDVSQKVKQTVAVTPEVTRRVIDKFSRGDEVKLQKPGALLASGPRAPAAGNSTLVTGHLLD
eukprot:m.10495 g.10495  ORF g.10495 m.10495 type:complete len:150 (-) comp3086_c0_seq1:1520-1969(-)